jgi:hypothetical protein
VNNVDVVGLRILIQDLRSQWGLMWRERMDDRLKAEGVAVKDYENLFVERGLVIVATRDFKPLSFSEIVGKHVAAEDASRFIPPDSSIGGWRKFVRDVYCRQNVRGGSRRKLYAPDTLERKKSGPPKKGGRGWVHKV